MGYAKTAEEAATINDHIRERLAGFRAAQSVTDCSETEHAGEQTPQSNGELLKDFDGLAIAVLKG